MPALTITAVNAGTDQLTIAAHGLNTGDGPGTIYTPNGTIPAGLAPVTDVYAIRVDANNIKLATSSANALLGTAIDITSAGSGTLLLLLGLPYRRPRTYAALQQLKSVDLNALFDDDIALWNLLTGQAQSVYTGITLPANQHVTVSGTGGFKHGDRTLAIPASAFSSDVASTFNLAGYRTLSGLGRLLATVPLAAGKRIKSCTVYYDPQASGGVLPRLSRRTIASGAQNYIWQGISDNTGSAIESQTGSALNYTMLDTEFYEFEVAIAGASNRLWGATLIYDEP